MKKMFFSCCVFFSVLLFSQSALNSIPLNVEIPLCLAHSAQHINSGFDSHELRTYSAYSLCYREHYEQAEWVAYDFTWKELQTIAKRTNDFRSDAAISTGSAQLEDYKYSGYDRGHLAPAADFVFSEQAMSETFFLTNMSPQNASFNRGIWSRLESQVRFWAKKYGRVWVITGPILEKTDYKTIGTNAVAVPEYFYKVIAAFVKNKWQAIGFIIPNEAQSAPVLTFAVTIREIEARTGIDFLHALPQHIQDDIEKSVQVSVWE